MVVVAVRVIHKASVRGAGWWWCEATPRGHREGHAYTIEIKVEYRVDRGILYESCGVWLWGYVCYLHKYCHPSLTIITLQ